MIVSSHVLNEVERLAERVIVLMHGRLAAAGGHHAIRDAMDDRPRHVLVRSDDGRRLAAVADRARVGRRRDVRPGARRARDPDRCRPASWRPRCRGSRATRRSGCSRCARSTTRSRACSGSWSDDASPTPAHDRARPRSRFVAILVYTLQSCFPPKRWAARAAAVRRRAAVRAARLRRRRAPPQRAFANVAADGIFGLVMPIAALVIGDSVLGAEVRAGTFHFTWLSPDADVADRARSLAGRLARRARHDRAGVRARRGRRRHARRAPAPAFVAAAVGSVAYVAVFIAIGCLTRRTAVWSLAFVFLVERLLGAALTGIAQLSPTWESRAIFVGYLDDAPSRLVRDGIPQGGARGRPAR